jgi:hypothetical protein
MIADLLLGYLGLEPRAYRLKAEYSTIELATRCFLYGINTSGSFSPLYPRAAYFNCVLFYPQGG